MKNIPGSIRNQCKNFEAFFDKEVAGKNCYESRRPASEEHDRTSIEKARRIAKMQTESFILKRDRRSGHPKMTVVVWLQNEERST